MSESNENETKAAPRLNIEAGSTSNLLLGFDPIITIYEGEDQVELYLKVQPDGTYVLSR